MPTHTTDTPHKHIHVVAGIIWNEDKTKILLSQRKSDQDFSGLWEFPGGKVEADEKEETALLRELQEELKIDVTDYAPAIAFPFEYPSKTIDFTIYEVFAFTGIPVGAESQIVVWVKKEELQNLEFPEANQRMIAYILNNSH